MRFLQRCRSLKCRKLFGILPEMIVGNISNVVICPHCGHKNKITSVVLKKLKMVA